MTRSVADSALMLKTMAGPHHLDHYLLGKPAGRLSGPAEKGPRRSARCLFADLGHARVDPEVADLVAAGVTVFEDMGCHVEQVGGDQLAFVRDGLEMIRFFWAVHETANYGHLLEQWEDQLTLAWSLASRPAPAIARLTI